MGKTIAMQPMVTLRGNIPNPVEARDIPQPAVGWVNAVESKDAVFHVTILEKTSTGNNADLIIETAASAAGPWTNLMTYDSGAVLPLFNSFAASTGGVITDQLERFVRWRVDTKDLVADNTWAFCFGICVTLK